jgi:PEP-CTERM motif
VCGGGAWNLLPPRWRIDHLNLALFNAYGNLTTVSEFTNVQSSGVYWSGTEVNADLAVFFNPVDKFAFASERENLLFAVAVRPGDVTAPVPEPQTLALTLLALGATVVARRRRPR